jgi:hypothetical protein
MKRAQPIISSLDIACEKSLRQMDFVFAYGKLSNIYNASYVDILLQSFLSSISCQISVAGTNEFTQYLSRILIKKTSAQNYEFFFARRKRERIFSVSTVILL